MVIVSRKLRPLPRLVLTVWAAFQYIANNASTKEVDFVALIDSVSHLAFHSFSVLACCFVYLWPRVSPSQSDIFTLERSRLVHDFYTRNFAPSSLSLNLADECRLSTCEQCNVSGRAVKRCLTYIST